MFKLIVMSDLHIVPSGELSHSIDTFDRLQKAVAHINRFHSDAELCILNGDLADHGDVAAYQQVKDALIELKTPVVFTLGNHDDAEAFEQVFGADDAVFDHSLAIADHQVIVLNTRDPGKTAGILTQDQEGWFEAEMMRATGKPVIIVLHHPIADQGIGTDFLRLQNPERLIAACKKHGGVRQVISAHIHTTCCGMVDGVPVATLAGNHYNFSPFSDPDISDMVRTEGPGELAVILTDAVQTTLHFDKFADGNAPMDAKLFVWKGA